MELARLVGPDYPIHAFRTSGTEPDEPIYAELPPLVARMVEEVLEVRPHGPYLLGGHSAGGTIAHEMACQLAERGRGPLRVWMADSGSTPHYERLNILGADDLIEVLAAFKVIAPQAHDAMVTALRDDPLLRQVIVHNCRALATYRPRRTTASVVYFRARERDEVLEQHPEAWWMALADGEFTLHNVAGNHLTMIERPHVATLARLIRRQADEADE
jgi:thioesterase domain-containing protein